MLQRSWGPAVGKYLCVPEMSRDVVSTVAKLDRQDLMHS